jgi:hypothetical protein
MSVANRIGNPVSAFTHHGGRTWAKRPGDGTGAIGSIWLLVAATLTR